MAQYKGNSDEWIDDCNADRDPWTAGNPNGAGTWEETNKGSYPGVGVECQGFAQISNQQKRKIRKHHYKNKHHKGKTCPDDMPDCNGSNGLPGRDCCDD